MLFARVPLLYGVCAAITAVGIRSPSVPSLHYLAQWRRASPSCWSVTIAVTNICTTAFVVAVYMIVQGLCLLLSWLSMLVERTAPIVIRFLRYVGGCTLEIYRAYVCIPCRAAPWMPIFSTALIALASYHRRILPVPFWHLPLL
uniref:hypothetical protein n=1 Tax=Gemmiger formicilis TaxID=745368 RepID=UPI003FF1011B